MVTAFNALLECLVTALFVVLMLEWLNRYYAEKEQQYLTEQAQKNMDEDNDHE